MWNLERYFTSWRLILSSSSCDDVKRQGSIPWRAVAAARIDRYIRTLVARLLLCVHVAACERINSDFRLKYLEHLNTMWWMVACAGQYIWCSWWQCERTDRNNREQRIPSPLGQGHDIHCQVSWLGSCHVSNHRRRVGSSEWRHGGAVLSSVQLYADRISHGGTAWRQRKLGRRDQFICSHTNWTVVISCGINEFVVKTNFCVICYVQCECSDLLSPSCWVAFWIRFRLRIAIGNLTNLPLCRVGLYWAHTVTVVFKWI